MIRVAVAMNPELRFQENLILQAILENYAEDAMKDKGVMIVAGEMAVEILTEWKQSEMRKLATPAKVIRKSCVSTSKGAGK